VRGTRKAELCKQLLCYKSSTYCSRPINSFTKRLPSYELNSSWGHSLPTINPSETFRLFLQNPNGLSLHSSNYSLQYDLNLCKDYGAALLCLPEVKVNWNAPNRNALLNIFLRRTWRSTVISASKSPEEVLSDTQPGGTCTVLCNNWVSCLVDKGEDPTGLGRWSYITLRGRQHTKITIVTAYNATYNLGDIMSFILIPRLRSYMGDNRAEQ
jgi:hypothetical protein